MPKSFEECLQLIYKEKQMSPEDRELYAQDAEKIRDHLINKMKESCPFFKASYDGLSSTGNYLDHLKIDLPDKLDLNLKIKLPFKLTPCEDKQRPGFISLFCDKSRDHPAIGKKGRISRYNLQMWIHSAIHAAIREGYRLDIGGRIYQVNYPKLGRGRGVTHTVTAIEVDKSGREIPFDFVPVFEFSHNEWPFKHNKLKISNEDKSWFAVPWGKVLECRKEQANSFTFMACAQHWERAKLWDKENLKNSLCLMKAIRDANGLNLLTIYMIKSIYLLKLNDHPSEFWEQSIGDILIAMLEVLAESLNDFHLPFLLHKGVEHLDPLTKKIKIEYFTKVESILRRLKSFKEKPNIIFDEIMMIFIKEKQAKNGALK